MDNVKMGVLGALRLSTGLLECRELRELHLSGNRLSISGSVSLIRTLPLYRELRIVDLSYNGMDAEVIKVGGASSAQLLHPPSRTSGRRTVLSCRI